MPVEVSREDIKNRLLKARLVEDLNTIKRTAKKMLTEFQEGSKRVTEEKEREKIQHGFDILYNIIGNEIADVIKEIEDSRLFTEDDLIELGLDETAKRRFGPKGGSRKSRKTSRKSKKSRKSRRKY
jgi:aryl carrier-like protein